MVRKNGLQAGWQWLVVAPLWLAAAACGVGEGDRAEAAIPSRYGAADVQGVVTAATRRACEILSGLLQEMPPLNVGSRDSTVRDPMTGAETWGCTLAVTGSRSGFPVGETPDEMLRRALTDRGWREDYDYGADGVDGTAFGFRLGHVLCLFQGAWDGGDITDPTYVPEDWYRLTVQCVEPAATRGSE